MGTSAQDQRWRSDVPVASTDGACAWAQGALWYGTGTLGSLGIPLTLASMGQGGGVRERQS